LGYWGGEKFSKTKQGGRPGESGQKHEKTEGCPRLEKPAPNGWNKQRGLGWNLAQGGRKKLTHKGIVFMKKKNMKCPGKEDQEHGEGKRGGASKKKSTYGAGGEKN